MTELVTTGVLQAAIERAQEALTANILTANGVEYETLRVELSCYGKALCQAAVSGRLAGARHADEWLFDSTGDFASPLVLNTVQTRLRSVPPDTAAALLGIVAADNAASEAVADFDAEPDITWYPTEPRTYELVFRPPLAGGPGDPGVEDLTKIVIRVDARRERVMSIEELPLVP